MVLARYSTAGVSLVQFESEDVSATCFSYLAIYYLSMVTVIIKHIRISVELDGYLSHNLPPSLETVDLRLT